MPKTTVSQKVLVLRKGRILGLRRSKSDPAHSGCWDFPGGIVKWGEAIDKSIVREVLEETGLILKHYELLAAESHISKTTGVYMVTIAYCAEHRNGFAIKLSPEHDRLKWMSPQEFLRCKATRKVKFFIKTLVKKRKLKQNPIIL